MQLAGYLRGRAQVEWNLLSAEEKCTYAAAIQALRIRLDPGSKVLATQDFRHAIQKDEESVADYIRRVEHYFQIAYGHDNLSVETREAMLFGQLQAGLKYSIMKSPAVSGCQSYRDLRVAAKNEEKCLVELRHRQQYQKNQGHQGNPKKSSENSSGQQDVVHRPPSGRRVLKCYKCGSTDHLQRNCRAPKKESTVQPNQGGRQSGAKMVQSTPTESQPADPMQYLASDEEDPNSVRTVRVTDQGSRLPMATVDVQGVQIEGAIDTGADITIMGAELFKRVAAVAHLKKSQLKPPDKTPYTYDHKPFKLDGKFELDITFQGQTILTPVYLKMDARESLLLSEGVCCQLGMVSYHPSVKVCQPCDETSQPNARVGGVHVRLVQTVRLAPCKTSMVTVQVEGDNTLIVY